MSELSCRLATAGDLDVVLGLMAEFNAGEGITFNAPPFRASAAKLIEDQSLGLLPLFAISNRVVGYAALTWGFDLEFGGRDSFLTELFLVPQVRGGGLGRQALAHVEELARTHGASAVHLGVRPENVPALRLYESSGYEAWPRKFLTKLL